MSAVRRDDQLDGGEVGVRRGVGLFDGSLSATVTLPGPGMYRVELDGGGASPVSDLMMAVPAADLGEPAP
jgi:hypothetical protein